MINKFILITGCSGGGKSTLLSALADRGFSTVVEPGRRIVSEELARHGAALPWVSPRAFAERAVEVAQSDLEKAQHTEGLTFFDRGLIDAALALEHSGGPSANEILGKTRTYARRVFVVPPWEAIFANDPERRHSFAAAVEEHTRIIQALDRLGYEMHELPRVSVRERVLIVLQNGDHS